MPLTVATCQFPVSAAPRQNLRHIVRLLRIARDRGAQLAHFPECALSGYAGVDLPSYRGYDWTEHEACAREVMAAAAAHKLWVVLGAAHRLSGRHKPHNSLYIIDDRGQLVDRYDKMFCASGPDGKGVELAHFTPGDHLCLFSVGGVRCGALICHEYRYPELYRAYKQRGAQLVLHSFHAGNLTPARHEALRAQVGEGLARVNHGATLPEITMRAGMHASASNNYVWISCANTSARESCWSAFMVRPDGVITGQLRRNTAGALLTRVDPRARFYDSTVAWRDRAMRGVLHSGALVDDPRSADRTRL
ncbi:MAG: carbon-nitrogen hydrolase family protein [Myxococcales bacterium]|nr:carbon-nitrogen hydrolase family protein [Myxococcales bacterium]